MTTGAYPPVTSSNEVSVGITNAANFIPELWSNEIIASYKANLVLGSLVTTFEHQGRKGDTFHIPTPTRGSAAAKSQYTAVTLTANVESVTNISIDKHYHYARLIEDLAGVQALDSMRMFYTDDSGYALATQIDTDLHQLGSGLNGGTAYPNYTGAVIGGDGSTAWSAATTGNGTTLTDAGIRRMIRAELDDNNVPQDSRALIIPPIEKENLLGLSRFTEQAFVGEVGAANSIRTGRVGSIYGIDVYVSTNCPTIESADSTSYRVGLLIHKSAMALVMQQEIRVQAQNKVEYLSDLMVADTIYGVGELRNDGGVAFVVPAS